MKTIYLDCFSGISGNMLIGAFLDAGMPKEYFETQLQKLNLADEYSLIIKNVTKSGIKAVYFNVALNNTASNERILADIQKIITESALSERVQQTALAVFNNLAEAEAAVHGTDINHVHFHEVGAVDAIIDIVGIAVCLEYFDIENIFAGNLYTGTGFINCSHGQMPIPAPAAAELLKGFSIKKGFIEKELITPTGAAVIKALAKSAVPQQELFYDKIAYGAGTWDLPQPNVLRMYIKTSDESPAADELMLLEANIDDMNPQIFSYVSDKLFKTGALDVWVTPIMMKKNRPAQMLSVLINEDGYTASSDIIFHETTTLGIRINKINRVCLKRKMVLVSTSYGPVHCKIAYYNGKASNISAEYEDCRQLAEKINVPIKKIQDEARRLACSLTENKK